MKDQSLDYKESSARSNGSTLLVGGLGLISLFIVSAASVMPSGMAKGILLVIIAPLMILAALGLSALKLWRMKHTRVAEKAWLVLGCASAIIAILILAFTIYEAAGA